MRKLTFLACAAMLTSAVVFTGCKNDKEPNAKVPSVTTDIAIALPAQVGGPSVRHMPGVTVQTNGASDFTTNGMKGINLVPFAASATVTTSSTRHGENLELGNIGTTYNYSPATNAKAKVFTGQQVPMGTSAFLFYGESNATSSDADAYFKIGKLSGNLSTNTPAGFSFKLDPIKPNSTDVTNDTKYINLLAYLNLVAQASDGTKEWRNYTTEDNEGYAEMFATYATARNLNSFGVQRMMTDLYKSIKPNGDALATAIKTAIANSTYATVDADGNVTLDATNCGGFPANLYLPDGAIAVEYNTTSKEFVGSASYEYNGMEVANTALYTYPASLWYYANSRIKTSTTSEAEHYTAETAANWDAILTQYSKDNGSVNSKTRSLALKEVVQYGVARLDVKLHAAETLTDLNPVTSNRNIQNTTGYQLTGVLIGGQKNVGFDFTPATLSSSDASYGTSYTIYDRVMTGSSAILADPTNWSATNSTLVLETAVDQDVYIAVELLNNSTHDFYGADGVVPAGGKFYLVGQLKADPQSPAAANPSKKVFRQDYTTTAQLTIVNLEKAYNTIPDLKAPQVEVGLSVDLTWSEGYTYSVDL
jgi:hypothetical protein